jgi:hypothetical protein
MSKPKSIKYFDSKKQKIEIRLVIFNFKKEMYNYYVESCQTKNNIKNKSVTILIPKSKSVASHHSCHSKSHDILGML